MEILIENSPAPSVEVPRLVRARPAVHPFSCPTAAARSEWRENELWWIINGQEVSDKALRSWCYINLEYPWCFVDVVRTYHVNAWAYDNCPNDKDQATRGA